MQNNQEFHSVDEMLVLSNTITPYLMMVKNCINNTAPSECEVLPRLEQLIHTMDVSKFREPVFALDMALKFGKYLTHLGHIKDIFIYNKFFTEIHPILAFISAPILEVMHDLGFDMDMAKPVLDRIRFINNNSRSIKILEQQLINNVYYTNKSIPGNPDIKIAYYSRLNIGSALQSAKKAFNTSPQFNDAVFHICSYIVDDPKTLNDNIQLFIQRINDAFPDLKEIMNVCGKIDGNNLSKIAQKVSGIKWTQIRVELNKLFELLTQNDNYDMRKQCVVEILILMKNKVQWVDDKPMISNRPPAIQFAHALIRYHIFNDYEPMSKWLKKFQYKKYQKTKLGKYRIGTVADIMDAKFPYFANTPLTVNPKSCKLTKGDMYNLLENGYGGILCG